MMKKYYLLFAALILLLVDVPLQLLGYPEFIPFKTEAPQTVDMVIGHVIGNPGRLDLFSDLVGYVLLVISAIRLFPTNRKFGGVIFWGLSACVMRTLWIAMPFMANGEVRFRLGYILFFIVAALKVVAIFAAMYAFTRYLESLSNHSYNNVTVIFAMLSMICGIVFHVIWFYELVLVAYLYYAAMLIFAGVYGYRIYKDRDMLEIQ